MITDAAMTKEFRFAVFLGYGFGYASALKFRNKALDSDFKESEHKRDKNGQFASTGSGSSAGLSQKQIDSAIEKVLKDIDGKSFKQLKREAKQQSIEQDYGKEIKNPKGHNPIHTLVKAREGHIKDAYQRPDVPGLEHIDVFWGNASAGLMHIIKRRLGNNSESGKEHVKNILKNLDDVIRHGSIDKNASDDRNLVLTYNGNKAVISLSYKEDGTKHAVISGYSGK